MPPTQSPQQRKLSFIQMAGELMTRAEFKDAFQRATNMWRHARADLEAFITTKMQGTEQLLIARIDTRLHELKSGKNGRDGKDGQSIKGDKGDMPAVEDVARTLKPAVLETLKSLIPAPIKGDPGEPAKPLDPKEVAKMTIPEVFAEIDRRIPLLSDALRFGLEQHITDYFRKLDYGGGAVLAVMQAGTLKAQQANTLNFKGAGAPTISIGSNGVTHLDFPSTGAGLTALAATETPNSVLTVFTFSTASAQPSYIVSDNVWMKATTKSGTVNWTWSAGTKKATMTIPPQDDIWGVV